MGRFWRLTFFDFFVEPPFRSEKVCSNLPATSEDGERGQSEPLMTREIEEAEEYPRYRIDRGCSRSFLLSCPAFATFILLSLLFGIAIGAVAKAHSQMAIKDDQHGYGRRIKPCGSTPAEARKAGCHFDVISFCWLPAECYDAELSQEFDDENQLEWFLDANRTQPLSHRDIMTGEYTGLYVNWEYHLRHCTAMWKKLHRAVLGNSGRRAIDSYIGTYMHTKHCEQMLLSDRSIGWDVMNTRIAVKYPDCGI